MLLKRTTFKGLITALLIVALTISKAIAGYGVILIYHKFDEPKSPSTSVSIKDFKNQMEYLKKHNYNVVSLSELISYIKSGKIPEKTVAITIDDGYKSTMKAFKILKKFNYPFTLFLYAEGLNRYPAYLTEKELKEIAKYSKVTFGNHSYSHKRFAKLIKTMDKREYVKLIVEDTKKANEKIEKLTGKKPGFYAFPYGEYNKVYIEVLKKFNFKSIFSQDDVSVSIYTPTFLIPRKPVVGSWSNMKKFIKALHKEPLPVISNTPDIGVIKNNPIKISAVVKNPENYKYCGIYISEKGWMRAEKRGNKIYLKKPVKITKWKNRISVECFNKETKRRANFIRMIIH